VIFASIERLFYDASYKNADAYIDVGSEIILFNAYA
jgi:hypothetical protein